MTGFTGGDVVACRGQYAVVLHSRDSEIVFAPIVINPEYGHRAFLPYADCEAGETALPSSGQSAVLCVPGRTRLHPAMTRCGTITPRSLETIGRIAAMELLSRREEDKTTIHSGIDMDSRFGTALSGSSAWCGRRVPRRGSQGGASTA